MTMKIQDVLGQIDTEAATQKEDRTRHADPIRIPSILEVGATLRQGDVYLRYLGEQEGLVGLSPTEAPPALGEGSATGARHVAHGARLIPAKYTPEGVREEVMFGELHASGTWCLRHPEHADLVNLPAGRYVAWGQWDETTQRRVAD